MIVAGCMTAHRDNLFDANDAGIARFALGFEPIAAKIAFFNGYFVTGAHAPDGAVIALAPDMAIFQQKNALSGAVGVNIDQHRFNLLRIDDIAFLLHRFRPIPALRSLILPAALLFV